MKNFYLTLIGAIVAVFSAAGQVVTTVPTVVQRSSQNIVVTFHADQGNRGLMGVVPPTDVYAHTGVILEGNPSWQFAPAWGDKAAKYKMTYTGSNTWTLNIPSIQSYYGLTASQTAKVEKLAFVFRTADNSKEGKSENNSDIFVDVAPDGFAMRLDYDTSTTLLSNVTDVAFEVNTTAPATISLYENSASSTPFATISNATVLKATHRIGAIGETKIIAKAKSVDGKTAEESVTFTLVGASPENPYPAAKPIMGPVENPDGSVTFCIAAPGKESVMIIGDWNNYAFTSSQLMNHYDYDGFRYFWVTVPGLADGSDHIYYFLVDFKQAVGDPYARLVLDPFNDKYIPASVFPDMPTYPDEYVSGTPVAIYNSSMSDYPWINTNFKRVDQSQLVIYELLIRDFTGTEGASRGEGTIAGVMDKLDYLQDLGVNAIELLPIMEFNGNNSWGYNTNFYFAPDKAYGTPNDYRALIDECHGRGMAVILDIVFNQSDGLHPWYMMYPITRNPFYNGTAPHSYSVLNDWNQNNPIVQQQFKDALKFWLKEYHVDGFRFDLVKGLGENQSYDATYNAAENSWSGVTENKTNAFNESRVLRMKELHNAMREVDPTAYFINENLAGAKEENAMATDGETNWANINHESCQFAAGNSSNSNMNRFYAPLDSRTWGSTVSYAESHDEERLAYYVSKNGVSGIKGSQRTMTRRLGSVGAIMLMTPGAHMIWQFQELGANQTTKQADGGNDTSPKKVVWSLLNNANNAGIMQSYKDLCNLRRDNPELFAEGVNTTMGCGVDNWTNGRYITLKAGGKSLYLVVNANAANASKSIAMVGATASEPLQLLSCSYGVTPTRSGNTISLPGGAYAVYGSMNVAGVNGAESDADAVKVFGGNGRIFISGNYDNLSAWNLSGQSVNPDGPLAAGFYIVSVDGQTSKVAVR